MGWPDAVDCTSAPEVAILVGVRAVLQVRDASAGTTSRGSIESVARQVGGQPDVSPLIAAATKIERVEATGSIKHFPR